MFLSFKSRAHWRQNVAGRHFVGDIGDKMSPPSGDNFVASVDKSHKTETTDVI